MTSRKNRLLSLATAVVSVAVLAGGYLAQADPGTDRRHDLRSAMLTEREHPAGTQIVSTVTMREAVAAALPGTAEPSGIVVMPRCVSYFAAMGGLETLQGWHQFGFRPDGSIFIHFVARGPRDAIDMIKLRVGTCADGFMTVQGWPPSATGGGEIVTGQLSFRERPVPSVRNATTYGLTQANTFHDPDNALVRTIREAWHCPDSPCDAYDSMISRGDLYIYVHEDSSPELADQMARLLYDRATR